MAKNTEIGINKIEDRLLKLINQFGIRIERAYQEMSNNNPGTLWFGFSPEKSEDLNKILNFQLFISKDLRDNLFKFKNAYPYRLDFYIEQDKAVHFYEYIDQLSVPQDLNEIFHGSDMYDFLRDFSNGEIAEIVNYYPEKVRTFMINEYLKLFKENAADRLDECIKHDNYYQPLRYYVWSQFISFGTWHLYLDEISYGQSEDWAQLVAAGKPNRLPDERYCDAFRTLRHKNWNSAICNLRLNIRRRFGKESDLFADKYFDLITGFSSNPLADTQSYMSIYNKCISEGRSHIFADIFAQGMISGDRTGDVIYWEEKAEIGNHKNI